MKYYIHYDFDLEPKEVEDPAKAVNYVENRLLKDERDLKVFWRRDDLGWENKFVEYTHAELIEYLNKNGEITLQLAIEENDGLWCVGTIAHIYTENKEEENNREAQAALSELFRVDSLVAEQRKKDRKVERNRRKKANAASSR